MKTTRPFASLASSRRGPSPARRRCCPSDSSGLP
uniref:Uncharacterized protein n=1 Tax=Arundo donax TaxID=35708 RepID=A0A0A9E3I9_ARUDO